jgi:endonuclease/exonuclease/phosphatase (EEP) superfamily protein YafD
VTSHRSAPEHSPLLLLGAFVAIAALLSGLIWLAGGRDGGAADPAAAITGPSTSRTTTPSSTASDGSAADRMADAAEAAARTRIQPGQVLVRKPERPRLLPASPGRSGTGLQLGLLPDLDLPVGEPVEGEVTAAVANIPDRTSSGGFASSLRTLTGSGADVVLLNEVSGRSTESMQALAPGYGAYRDPVRDGSRGGTQSMTNAVMWRTDRWTMVDGGRVKVVDDDTGFHGGRAFTWDRYATWAVLQGEDGAIVSVVSTHMMTNPAKFPRQHARRGMTRVQQYARGMDVLTALVGRLAAHGPVLLGGDMNSHHGQGGWTAAAKMTAAGFDYTKDRGVMHLFYQGGVGLVGHRQVGVASDHPAIVTTLDMSGQGAS